MIESVKDLVSCKWCNQILAEPVLLPCGETICAKHQLSLADSLKCKICEQDHNLKSTDQLITNKLAQELLDLRIKDLEFGKVHVQAANNLKELRESINQYEQFRKDPHEVIFAFFDEIRSRVDLTRENLIQKINECSEGLIIELDQHAKECKLSLAILNTKIFDEKLTIIKSDLSKWEKSVRNLVIDEDLWSMITKQSDEYLNGMENMASMHREAIFLGRANRIEIESKFSDVLGIFGEHVGFEK
jgi:hypothetical protein